MLKVHTQVNVIIIGFGEKFFFSSFFSLFRLDNCTYQVKYFQKELVAFRIISRSPYSMFSKIFLNEAVDALQCTVSAVRINARRSAVAKPLPLSANAFVDVPIVRFIGPCREIKTYRLLVCVEPTNVTGKPVAFWQWQLFANILPK